MNGTHFTNHFDSSLASARKATALVLGIAASAAVLGIAMVALLSAGTPNSSAIQSKQSAAFDTPAEATHDAAEGKNREQIQRLTQLPAADDAGLPTVHSESTIPHFERSNEPAITVDATNPYGG